MTALADPDQRSSAWAGTVALLCTAQFVVVLDATIVAIALPAIRDSLHMATADLQWVLSAYTLAFAGFLVLAGRLADLHGRRRVFMAGLTLFSVASLACGLSTSPAMLIAARAVQGLGAAARAPAAPAAVTGASRRGPGCAGGDYGRDPRRPGPAARPRHLDRGRGGRRRRGMGTGRRPDRAGGLAVGLPRQRAGRSGGGGAPAPGRAPAR